MSHKEMLLKHLVSAVREGEQSGQAQVPCTRVSEKENAQWLRMGNRIPSARPFPRYNSVTSEESISMEFGYKH